MSSTKQPAIVLVAAKPGIMRNSLQSYLRTIPHIHDIVLADDALAAFHVICSHKLTLVIVDADLSESEMLGLVYQARTEKPHIQIVALVENMRQRQLCLSAGANHALLKGFLDEQLRQAILSDLESF
ncbi:MAG: response regulator transcription factor [Chloroflexi bacterium]|nr:response regulator transcription factor [Chloroflexota bacterium]